MRALASTSCVFGFGARTLCMPRLLGARSILLHLMRLDIKTYKAAELKIVIVRGKQFPFGESAVSQGCILRSSYA